MPDLVFIASPGLKGVAKPKSMSFKRLVSMLSMV